MEDKKITVDAKLLQQYYLGLCTPEECAAIEQWLNDETIEAAQANRPVNHEKSDQSWERLRNHLALPDDTSITRLPIKTSGRTAWWSIAASFLILISFSVFIYHRQQQPSKTNTIQKQLATQAGQKLKITLPDGTLVMLNAGSTLRYPEDFGKRERSVFLEGEAWFDIQKVANKPFQVHTAHTLTQVLGTQFNLNTFQNGEDKIYVESGQVKWTLLKDKQVSRILHAQEGAQSKSTGTIVSVATPHASAWKAEQLVFKDTPLAEVCTILSRWYALDIQLSNPTLRDMPYTAHFEQPTINEVLQNISFVLGTSYSINHKHVIIH